MQTLAIIQARGGSKRLPGKNVRDFCGKPLIAWTIEAAQEAERIERVVVSTDDEHIASVAKTCGAEVPFLRPSEFAADFSKSVDLLCHALGWFKEHEEYTPDTVVQLKPTNPLRTSGHIDACVAAYKRDTFDSLITVRPVSEHPYKMWKVENDTAVPFLDEKFHGMKEAAKMPKQKLPAVFVQNSYVHVIKRETILEKHSSVGENVQAYCMEEHDSVNIDTLQDFDVAEVLFKQQRT